MARGAPVEPTPARSRRGAHRARRSRSTGQKLFPVIGLVGLTAALTVTATFVVPAQARGERVTHRRKNAQVTKAAATSAAPNPLATPEITRYLAGQPGTIAAGLYDIDNGETYVYHPTDAETTASVIKVDILATMLYQSQRSGQSLTGADQQLATLMIENSDDNAAQELWDQVGANVGVGAFDQVAGLTHTTLNTQGLWGLSTTTVLDQIKVLRQVVQSQSLLTAASRQYELGLMENVEADQRWGVAFGLPAGVTIAIKDGWDPLDDGTIWQVNTEGWVDGDGRDYVLVILTEGESTEYVGIQTVDHLSDLIWAELAPPPP